MFIRNSGCGPALGADVPVHVVVHDGAGCSASPWAELRLSLTGVALAAGAAQSFAVSQALDSEFCTAAAHDDVSVFIDIDDNQSICEWSGDNNTWCADKIVTGMDDVLRCRFTLDSSEASFGPDGGDGTVSVTASDTGCPWTAASDAGWIEVSSAAGADNGTLDYAVQENTGAARIGTITIAGKTFTVRQENGCRLTIVPEKILKFIPGRDQAQERVSNSMLLQADGDVDFQLIAALLNLFRYTGPFKLFMVQADENTQFTFKDRPQWSPDTVKTLLRLRLSKRTMLVLAWIQPFKAREGQYTMTIDDCTGTMTIESLR